MENHFKLSDDNFENQFRNCEIDPALFSHEAHLRLAWIHIQKYGFETAVTNIQEQLKAFVAHVGAQDKYHHTLTVVAVNAVNHFMEKSETNDFQSFSIEFPQLKADFKTLVNSHYSFDIFANEIARIKYLEPDLIPF